MKNNKNRPRLWTLLAVVPAVTTLALAASPAAGADFLPDSYRLVASLDHYHDTVGVYGAWHLEASGILRSAHHLEATLGLMRANDRLVVGASIGPMWRWPIGRSRYQVEFGIAPSIRSSDRLGDKDIGGFFHFTSLLSIGMHVGQARQCRIALEVTHSSNGSLGKPNPGIDMISLRFSNIRD